MGLVNWFHRAGRCPYSRSVNLQTVHCELKVGHKGMHRGEGWEWWPGGWYAYPAREE